MWKGRDDLVKIAYIDKTFRQDSLSLIYQADEILTDLADQGFAVTLRTLYYQFVSLNLIENKESEYKRLGGIINDARLAGLIDWEHITDRTRNLQSIAHWKTPQEIIEVVAPSYTLDKWDSQTWRPEVWIEKDALLGVIEKTCRNLDVPFFSCRGYVSQSEMWRASVRLKHYLETGQTPIIFHLGDHDPSGIDMTRDIQDRLALFTGEDIAVKRLALNWEQIEKFSPPPNPTKVSDSRVGGYISRFGRSSWELDALPPQTIVKLIEDAISEIVDPLARDRTIQRQRKDKTLLEGVAREWDNIVDLLQDSSGA